MKLLAIDFSNLILRHYGSPYADAADLSGRTVRGAVGACGQVIRLLEEERPTHLLIARDGSRSENVRREIDPGYKAHRPDGDEDVAYQFEKAYEAVELLGWPALASRGYEADDVIASAARTASDAGGRTVIVSGDKDLLALCSERVRVQLLRPGAVKPCGPAECEEIFGVPPQRVCDYKALVGDSSDGIKGIRGVGPKSALALLAAHGSLEGIIDAARRDELAVKPAIAAKVKGGIDDALTSYRLAELHDRVEIELERLRCPSLPSYEELAGALREAGLGDLASRLPGAPKAAASQPVRDIEAVFARVVSRASRG